MNWLGLPCSLAGKIGQDKSPCVLLPLPEKSVVQEEPGKKAKRDSTSHAAPQPDAKKRPVKPGTDLTSTGISMKPS
jgi:hypothetical protein